MMEVDAEVVGMKVIRVQAPLGLIFRSLINFWIYLKKMCMLHLINVLRMLSYLGD